MFSQKDLAELVEHIRINNHSINQKIYNKLSYRSIYSLNLIKQKMLKTYIKVNLKN